MNVNLATGWGVVRTIVDLVFKQPEGKVSSFVGIEMCHRPTGPFFRSSASSEIPTQ